MIFNPKILSEHVVDCSSVESILTAIIRPGMSSREKAEAIYGFVREYRYHWSSAKEDRGDADYEYSVVYDPVKLFNVYGYGYCFQTAPVLEALYQAAGLEARCCGLSGHTVAEVYYEGAYHYYDADMHAFFRMPDGRTVASIEQCSRDPFGLVINQPHPSDPYLPTAAQPRVPYESKVILAGYLANRIGHHYRHDKIRLGHRMDITLLPGMRYVRGFEPAGQWNYRSGDHLTEFSLGYIDPAIGPVSESDGRHYGNGYLLYQPELTNRTGEYRAGVWAECNMGQDAQGLAPVQERVPAWSVFRVRVPYVIVGWPMQGGDRNEIAGAAVISATFSREEPQDAQSISVSTDEGRTWATVWQAGQVGQMHALVDLSAHVAGRYDYLVRMEMMAQDKPDRCRLSRMSIRTCFQCSPQALPAVRAGSTRMTFSLGDRTELLEFCPDISTEQGFLRDSYARHAIRFRPGRLASTGGEKGEIIYLLEPPQDGTIRDVAVNLGCRREPGQLDGQDEILVSVAENEPEGWRCIAADDVPAYMQHWSYELNGCVEGLAGVRRLFVKLAVRTHTSASIKNIRFVMRWQPSDAEARAGEPAVRVEHAWIEGGQPEIRKHAMVVRQFPMTYSVEAGDRVVNKYVLIEPVRDAECQWRDDDPPMMPPLLPPPSLVDPALRDEMRGALAAIEDDPLLALPSAAKSRIDWLASAAKTALFMYERKKRFPLPEFPERLNSPLDPVGRAINLLRQHEPEGTEAMRTILSEQDRFVKQRFLERLRIARLDYLPDAVLLGLNDSSRWVRLGTLRLLREPLSPASREALSKMALDDPLPFLRAEAAFLCLARCG